MLCTGELILCVINMTGYSFFLIRGRDFNRSESICVVLAIYETLVYTIWMMTILPLLALSRFIGHSRRPKRSWSLCSSWHRPLGRAAIPKFSPKNRSMVLRTLCQNYLSVLEDLTLDKHYAIAIYHPPGSHRGLIVKLRLGGRLSLISHRALRGHFIIVL